MGPLNSFEVVNDGTRLVLGSIWVPMRTGLDVSAQISQDTGKLVSISLTYDQSIASVEVFAASKEQDAWAETRYEIANKLEATKVQPKMVDGTFGTEIHAVMPTYDQQGNATIQAVRFLGINGDRWFMRVTISGLAATDETAGIKLDELIADLVVDRGTEPMAPGSRLPISYPKQPIDPVAQAPTIHLEI